MLKMFISILGVITILFCVIALQMVLCKKNNKFVGLIFPAVFIIISVLLSVGLWQYGKNVGTDTSVMVVAAAFVCNIPSVVTLAIYIGSLDKKHINDQFEREADKYDK